MSKDMFGVLMLASLSHALDLSANCCYNIPGNCSGPQLRCGKLEVIYLDDMINNYRIFLLFYTMSSSRNSI